MSIDDLLARALIPVLVKPGAPKTEILGIRSDALHVAVKAPPEDGKANAELCRFLSKQTGKRCSVLRGVTSKKKLVRCA